MEVSETDEHLTRLNQARDIVKTDQSLFPEIVRNILSVANYSDIRYKKWMANFLWFGFSSKNVKFEQKLDLAVTCLDTIVSLYAVDNEEVKKDVISCSCTIYPLVFLHCCTSPNDSSTWDTLTKLKNEIINDFDKGNKPLLISCIKFISCVILTQVPGIRDPRLVTKSDVSLSKVPTHHPFINSNTLRIEANDLIEKIFSILFSDSLNVLYITSVLNILPVLVKRRKELAPKIIGSLLEFHLPNPKDEIELSNESKLAIRCIEKNLKLTLLHLAKSTGASSSSVEKIHAYLSGQIYHTKVDESLKKRQYEGNISAASKRVKSSAVQSLVERMQPQLSSHDGLQNNPLISIFASQTAINPLANFDVTSIPVEVATEIVLTSLLKIDKNYFHQQINMLRERVRSLSEPESLGLDQQVDEDEDEDYEPPEVDVQTINASVEREAARLEGSAPSNVVTDAFELPTPDSLSPMAILEYFHGALSRLFDYAPQFERSIVSSSNLQNLTLENVDNTVWDKRHWAILLPRLCTRGLLNYQPVTSGEESGDASFTLSSFVRGQLFTYVASNWRSSTNLILNWLSEEWYNDRLMLENPDCHEYEDVKWEGPQYEKWALKVIDSILPYLEAKDKVFMIFMSELPELTDAIVDKIKFVCLDPDKTKLGFMTFQYLIMFRLPVREKCLDILETMWKENVDVKASAAKLLNRWRPSFLESVKSEETKEPSATDNTS